MLALLEAFPAGEPVVVLLDNLESVMDTERETLAEPALREALSAVLTGPAHAITMIATTRVRPTALLRVEPARQRQLRLAEGLGPQDARIVLRELDDDGHLGLRDASDDLLDGLCRHTRGNPRALEAVKAILEGDETLTPHDLLDRTRQLPGDDVVRVLVGEAYELLDRPAQQVMQALSVFPAPVSSVGVDFLLRPVDPTTDAAPIVTRLVHRQMARFQDGRYYLHPLDREYARASLPVGDPGDSRTAFTLAGLQARAADYYTQIRTPRDSWRSLEDVRPQLAEFELGDAAAALVVTAAERELTYPLGEPARYLLKGLALLELNRPDESAQAFNEALAAADALLALADRNVDALEARALTLSGLALAAGDTARAAEAAEAFAPARSVTTARGIVADTRRLLDISTKHDRAGVLTATGCGSGW